jgi:hypothetical protein
MTEEQKQALIEEGNRILKHGYGTKKSDELIKIALAALTAPPIGRVDRGAATDSNEYPDARVVCLHEHVGWEAFQDGCELFTRLAPAINLAELVPSIEALRAEFEEVERKSADGFNLHRYDTVYADDETQERWDLWLSCRAAILRNIEVAK